MMLDLRDIGLNTSQKNMIMSISMHKKQIQLCSL